MNYKLRGYQKRAVEFCLKNKKVLLWMCRGSGKTLVAIDLIDKLDKYPVLIVTPASVKYQFKAEIEKFSKNSNTIQVFNSKDILDKDANIIIINPDILSKYKKELIKLGFKLIIVDESHMIKNVKSQRTKSIISIGLNSEYKVAMTGSAITVAPLDLFGQLAFIKPETFGNKSKKFPDRKMSWYNFAVRYSGGKQNYFGFFEAKTATNVEELRSRTKNTIYRVEHQEALSSIPKLNEMDWMLTLEDRYMKKYNKIDKEFKKWLKEQGLTEYEVYKKLSSEALIKLSELRKLVSESKLVYIKDLCTSVIDSEKVIIFCHYRETLRKLEEIFKDKCISIKGGDSSERKAASVENFKTNDRIRYAIISISAGGTGINLQNCHDIVFADLPWSYKDYDQCCGRSHRINQKSVVNVYKLLTKGTVDEKINKFILNKKEFEKVI